MKVTLQRHDGDVAR